jgi:hypothetical protein
MSPLTIALLGLFTVILGGLGIANDIGLSSMYYYARARGGTYLSPLDLVSEIWIILGAIGILTGGLIGAASVIRELRRLWAWLLCFTFYVIVIILSLSQTQFYGSGASYAGESAQGLYGVIVGASVSIMLLTRGARTFFSSSGRTLQGKQGRE